MFYNPKPRKSYSGKIHHSWKGGKPRCIDCRNVTKDYNSKRCRKCFLKTKPFSGSKNPKWSGGSYITGNGYKKIHVFYEHPRANKGFVFEHILVMENIVNRYLTLDEIVHHKNGNKLDNRPKNLQLTNRKEHPTLHTKNMI